MKVDFPACCEKVRAWLHAGEARAFRWLYVIFVDGSFTLAESQDGSYATPADGTKESYLLELGRSTPTALAIAQAEYNEINARLATVTTKVGALQTVAGIVVSSTTAIIAFAGLAPGWLFKAVLAIFLLLIVFTIWFIFRFNGVGPFSIPEVDDDIKGSAFEDEHRRFLIRDLRFCVAINARRMNYLVDVYKGARRCFAAILFVAVVIAIWTSALGRKPQDEIVAKIQGDQELIAKLRGPAGRDGKDGSAGAMGEKGPSGPAGVPGQIFLPPVDGKLFGDTLPALDLRLQSHPRK